MSPFAILMTVLLALPLAPAGHAQEVVLRGGPSILASGPGTFSDAAVGAHVSAGARLWLTDVFQLQGSVGYDQRLTTEAALFLRPFASGARLEPYGFVGIGAQFVEGERTGLVPVGAGVLMDVGPATGVFAELAGRWVRRANPAAGLDDMTFFVAPSLGVAYRFGNRPSAPVRTARVNAEEPRLAQRNEPETVDAPAGEQAASGSLWMEDGRWTLDGDPGLQVHDTGDRVGVPDGTFIMGLTDEDPLSLQSSGLRRVTVSGFYLDKHEVSNAAYRAFIETLSANEQAAMTPDRGAWARARSSTNFESYYGSDRFADYPVVAVTWAQAVRFCESVGGRLPTEAEWEYAARSGRPGGVFPWPGFEARAPDGTYLANFNPGRGLYAADGYAFTAPVGSFPPSPWGLSDMAGNAAEWVADSYAPSFAALSNFNPRHDDPSEARRVVRGGSWASEEFYIGVGVRDAQPADEATIYTGFRCAYDLGSVELETPGPDAEPVGSR